MTQHVTIALDEQELSRARHLAESLGVTLEEYLQRLVRGQLSIPPSTAAPERDFSLIFGVGESAEPTNVAKDKHKLIGEAVWQEYLEETGRK